MIIIPWQDHTAAMACATCGKFGIEPIEIADHGYLGIYKNRLLVHLMNSTYNANINDIIAYDLDEFSYGCEHIFDSLRKYVDYINNERNAKLWNDGWKACTMENLGFTCDSAHDISKSLIGFITGHLKWDVSLSIVTKAGDLPPVQYHWDNDHLILECNGKYLTFEGYLSLLY